MKSLWQRLYDSAWHQPGSELLFGFIALALVARWIVAGGRARSPFLAAWLGLFGVEILLDAWLTAPHSPLLPDHGGLAGSLAIAFVLLGDVRFYVLVERYTRDPSAAPKPSAFTLRAVLAGLAWGSLVSVLMAPLARTVPAFQRELRLIFLTYELMALAQAIVWLTVVIPRRMRALATPAPAVARWLVGAARFIVAQYALWALADVIILWAHPAGFLLRVVPNVLYYGFFVGYVFWRAPPAIRS